MANEIEGIIRYRRACAGDSMSSTARRSKMATAVQTISSSPTPTSRTIARLPNLAHAPAADDADALSHVLGWFEPRTHNLRLLVHGHESACCAWPQRRRLIAPGQGDACRVPSSSHTSHEGCHDGRLFFPFLHLPGREGSAVSEVFNMERTERMKKKRVRYVLV